jgi:L-threonylcarbamoyladenylate synthase
MRELDCGPAPDPFDAHGQPKLSAFADSSTASAVSEAAKALSQGFLVAFPTETVYGLGADGLNSAAVARIFQAKGRPKGHPLILHAANLQGALKVSTQWSPLALGLANAFWPGPLTLILKKSDLVPSDVTGGQDSVGIRVPDQEVARRMLLAFAAQGSGLVAAPSANRFGGVSPTRASDVIKGLGPFLRAEDCLLKAGDCPLGLESTIVDCRDSVPRLLRPGGLSRERLNAWLKANAFSLLQTPSPQGEELRVSGSLDSHYAPRCPLLVWPRAQIEAFVRSGKALEDQGLAELTALNVPNRAEGLKLGLLLLEARAPWVSFSASSDAARPTRFNIDLQALAPESEAYARQFYRCLNDWDGKGVELILVERPPQTAAWEAIWDRLRRAASKS